MGIRFLLPLVLIFVCPTLTSAQPSFDCNKASAPTEHAICASASLSQLDNDLAQAYQQAVGKLGNSARDQLLAEQRIWIQSRDSCLYDGGCISASISARIATLHQVAGVMQAVPQPVQKPLLPEAIPSSASSTSIPNGIWSASYSCKYRSGKGMEEFAGRLLTTDTYEQRVFFQFVPLAEQNAPPRYALMHAPDDAGDAPIKMIDDFRSGIGGVKPFVLHPSGSDDILLADFASCKGIRFIRDQASPADARFSGNWSGKFEACGQWEASAQIDFVAAHDGNLFADIEYHRISSSRPGADYPGRSFLYGAWDSDIQQYKFTTLLRSPTLRDGSASPDQGWPLTDFSLRFDAAQDRLVGGMKECSYAEFAPYREGTQTAAVQADQGQGIAGAWEGVTYCKGAQTDLSMLLQNGTSGQLTGTLEVVGPNAMMEGVPKLAIAARPSGAAGRWDAVVAGVVIDAIANKGPRQFALELDAEKDTLRVSYEEEVCSATDLNRVSDPSPSRTPTTIASDGGTFFSRPRPQDRCENVLSWQNRIETEFPDLSLLNTATDRLYPKLALLFADDDFVPLFGQPYDAMSLEARQKVRQEIAQTCYNDPFYRNGFRGFSSIERGLTGNPERPLTSFGVPAIQAFVRQARSVRHEISALQEQISSAQTIDEAAPVARALAALVQNRSDHLWPSEQAEVKKAADDKLASLAMTDVEQDFAKISALTDPVEQLDELSKLGNGQKAYLRYLDSQHRTALQERIKQEQSQILGDLIEGDIQAIEALPEEVSSLSLLEEKAHHVSTKVAMVFEDVARPISTRIDAKRTAVLSAALAAKFAELDTFQPDLSGLQASVRWIDYYETVLGKYENKLGNQDVPALFARKREQLLNDAIGEFESDVSEAAIANGSEGVDAVVGEYLSWQGDENLPIWLDYSFIAESYK